MYRYNVFLKIAGQRTCEFTFLNGFVNAVSD